MISDKASYELCKNFEAALYKWTEEKLKVLGIGGLHTFLLDARAAAVKDFMENFALADKLSELHELEKQIAKLEVRAQEIRGDLVHALDLPRMPRSHAGFLSTIETIASNQLSEFLERRGEDADIEVATAYKLKETIFGAINGSKSATSAKKMLRRIYDELGLEWNIDEPEPRTITTENAAYDLVAEITGATALQDD